MAVISRDEARNLVSTQWSAGRDQPSAVIRRETSSPCNNQLAVISRDQARNLVSMPWSAVIRRGTSSPRRDQLAVISRDQARNPTSAPWSAGCDQPWSGEKICPYDMISWPSSAVIRHENLPPRCGHGGLGCEPLCGRGLQARALRAWHGGVAARRWHRGRLGCRRPAAAASTSESMGSFGI